MSEGKFLSKIELARRIAAVTQTESQIKYEDWDCVPKAVAFTHGYGINEYDLGLKPKALVSEVIRISETIAEKHGENTESRLFTLKQRTSIEEEIKDVLKESRAAWILYGNEKKSHILGLLKTDTDTFSVCNLGATAKSPYMKLDIKGVAKYLKDQTIFGELGACIIGFRKKEE
jgi:hypothetical protein